MTEVRQSAGSAGSSGRETKRIPTRPAEVQTPYTELSRSDIVTIQNRGGKIRLRVYQVGAEGVDGDPPILRILLTQLDSSGWSGELLMTYGTDRYARTSEYILKRFWKNDGDGRLRAVKAVSPFTVYKEG